MKKKPEQLELIKRDQLVNTPHDKYVEHQIERTLVEQAEVLMRLTKIKNFLEYLYSERKKYVS